MVSTFFSLNPQLQFYAYLLISVILLRLPLTGRYFRTLNTLLHESGHAVAAILTSGEVIRIELNSDTSGTALTKSSSKFRAFLVTFCGYPFAALASGGLLWLSAHHQYRYVFLILLTICLLNLMLFVRNSYGLVWLITFTIIITFIAWYQHALLTEIFSTLISLIAFAETILSTITIAYLGCFLPKKAGDITNLGRISQIPAFIWAFLLTAVVACIVYYTILYTFPNPVQPIVFSVVQS